MSPSSTRYSCSDVIGLILGGFHLNSRCGYLEIYCYVCVKCWHRPDFRFQDHISEEMTSQEDQPKKLILRRHRDCTSLEEVWVLHCSCWNCHSLCCWRFFTQNYSYRVLQFHWSNLHMLRRHTATANLLREIIMDRDNFLTLPGWFTRDDINDIIFSICVSWTVSYLCPVCFLLVFLFLSALSTMSLSILYFLYDFNIE